MNRLRLVARAFYFGAKLPWIMLFATARALGRVHRHAWLVLRFAGSKDHLFCAAGHANALVGRWKCGCGFELLGHAFAACPSCDDEAGWFPCRVCGLGIQDPLQR